MPDIEFLKSKPGAMRVGIIVATLIAVVVAFMSKGNPDRSTQKGREPKKQPAGLGNVWFFMIIDPVVMILSGFVLFRHMTDQLTEPLFNIPWKKLEFLIQGGGAFMLFIGCCVMFFNGQTTGLKLAGALALVAVGLLGFLAYENHNNPEEMLVRGESQQPVVKDKVSEHVTSSDEIGGGDKGVNNKTDTMATGISGGGKSESSEVFNQLHGQHNPSIDNRRINRYGSRLQSGQNAPATRAQSGQYVQNVLSHQPLAHLSHQSSAPQNKQNTPTEISVFQPPFNNRNRNSNNSNQNSRNSHNSNQNSRNSHNSRSHSGFSGNSGSPPRNLRKPAAYCMPNASDDESMVHPISYRSPNSPERLVSEVNNMNFAPPQQGGPPPRADNVGNLMGGDQINSAIGTSSQYMRDAEEFSRIRAAERVALENTLTRIKRVGEITDFSKPEISLTLSAPPRTMSLTDIPLAHNAVHNTVDVNDLPSELPSINTANMAIGNYQPHDFQRPLAAMESINPILNGPSRWEDPPLPDSFQK